MTFDAFINEYAGRGIDYGLGYQCVALMREYLKEVFGISPYILPPEKYAKLIYLNFTQRDVFDKIPNTPTNVPQEGDIVFWGYYPFVTSWPGHVAIFYKGDAKSFMSFDQNFPTGTRCHIQYHSYKGVLGWIHKK